MKTKIGSLFTYLVIALIGGFIAIFAYTKIVPQEQRIVKTIVEQPVGFAGIASGDLENSNFVDASQSSVEAVVHVKTQSVRESYNPIMEFFYGDSYQETQPVLGFGSGVIISNDGYIVTNNHVIANSNQIFVTLNDKREFEAKLIGADPNTDIALLKVEAEDLKYIPWGNSDDLKVGEWVLAVGNPFNLTSTVTAGIVSAKGKSVGIIQEQNRMESFIQTDAAVNRGNSGGALVNTKGELVGINTAIISPSGGYAGISFAVPVSMVRKVVKDIMEFGTVQRAVLGITIRELDAELAKEKGIDKIEGVYIESVSENGGAKKAGIEIGDIILSINEVAVNSMGELQEQVSRYRPNDKVQVLVKRKDKTKQFEVTLRNLQGSTEIVKAGAFEPQLGARFSELTKQEKDELGISHGVKVTELKPGKLKAEGVKEGFVIIQINNQVVNRAADVERILENVDGGVYIEGVYPNGVVAYYAFGLK
ncbi:MAG: Do family serine endopeptidase [Bacteroidales bacterium]|nr:Do family serine endopeptidase [Bacteroidales bacterium]